MNPEFIINANSPQIEQPDKICIPLKPHQLAMIYAMRNLEQSNKIPIVDSSNLNSDREDCYFQTSFGSLCDRVGSGKSLSLLGLIANQKILPNKSKCVRSFSNKIHKYSTFKYNIPVNLLFVPHGINIQWEKYIKEQTTLSYRVIKNKKTFEAYEEILEQYNQDYNPEVFTEDIVLASNTYYNKIADLLRGININRLLIDEIETIKVPASKNINAEFTWFISSSINILQNPNGTVAYEPYGYVNWQGIYVTHDRRVIKDKMPHNGFFKDTLTYVSAIDFRNQVYLKSEDEFVSQSFLLPDIITQNIKCKDSIFSHVLHGLVSPEVMAMINAGDIKGAIESSGIEQSSSENLVGLLTQEFENKLHNKRIEYEAKEKMTYSSADAKKKSLDKIKDSIQDLETKIECIKKRVLETEGCPICFDDITNRVIVTCCGNPFCLECLTLSLSTNQSCPLCRSRITQKDMIVLQEEDGGGCKCSQVEETDDSTRSKLENLEKYLREVMSQEGNKSILIFSEYEKSLQEIEKMLKSNHYHYSQLQGQTSFIQKTVDRFKNNEIPILLLNSRYFGSGLNLENTTHMFMFHRMKPHLDKQVIGRAQRPGRTEPLKLYRLCYNNEMY